MNSQIELLSVVAALEDTATLPRGQVGTVVEVLEPGVFDVEFSDDQGRTFALVALRSGQLLPLFFEPRASAAA